MGRWGPGVIGEEQFKKEEAVRSNPVQKFGPGILDEPTGKKRPRRTPRNIETATPPAEKPPEEPPTGGQGQPQEPPQDPPAGGQANSVEGQSIAQVTKALDANPALVDRYLEAERVRKPAPRKGVVHALLAAETATEAPRAAVVAELESYLKPAE